MGGTSVPMLSFLIAAIWNKSIGTEVPPTKAISPAKAITSTNAGVRSDCRRDRDSRHRSPRRSRPGAAA
ncbi:DUF6053 domain-containing protein [Lysobacter enzymogenes]|uniref:DUF6053 domain-containing protein n=1 Tax=Lysobacter enzymogenes TaxID=69 RepID=UPI003CCCAA1F